MFALFKKSTSREEEIEELAADLQEVRRELEFARQRFNHATEPELVDAMVYEMNALQARYDYLWRMLRERT